MEEEARAQEGHQEDPLIEVSVDNGDSGEEPIMTEVPESEFKESIFSKRPSLNGVQ